MIAKDFYTSKIICMLTAERTNNPKVKNDTRGKGLQW